MKDRGMISILYLTIWSVIGSPTQSSLQFKVFQSGTPFPASDHGRLLLLPGPCWPHKIVEQSTGLLRPLVNSRVPRRS